MYLIGLSLFRTGPGLRMGGLYPPIKMEGPEKEDHVVRVGFWITEFQQTWKPRSACVQSVNHAYFTKL